MRPVKRAARQRGDRATARMEARRAETAARWLGSRQPYAGIAGIAASPTSWTWINGNINSGFARG